MQVFDDPGLLPTTKNICFAGPRPARLPDHGRRDSAAMVEIKQRLKQTILSHFSQGKTTFLNGCMSGFDVIAGETVLSLKQEYPAIRCVTAAPFRLDYFRNENWTPEWKARALDLYLRSDAAFSLSQTYHKGVYYERNRFMVDHSAALICYYTGAGTGTKYTMDYAAKKRLEIANIAQPPQGNGESL